MTTPQPIDPAVADALNECLEAVLRGESIADCLNRYPYLADELRPLLLTSAVAAEAAPPRDETARRVRQLRFDGAVHHHLATKRTRGWGFLSPFRWWERRSSAWSRAWAVGLSTLVLTLALSTGAALASTDALPDSPLYPVKRVTERARLAVTFSEDSRALYHLELIERRTLELAAVAESGKTEHVAELSNDVLKNIEFARVEAGYTPSGEMVMTDVSAESAPISALSAASPLDSASVQQTGLAERAAPSLAYDQGGDPTADAQQIAASAPTLDGETPTFLEAERDTAAQAYAALLIAQQLAPEHARPHFTHARMLAEQRYRETRLQGEAQPISHTLFAQGIVRINGGVMTLSGNLRFVIAHNALGNRPPEDGDFATVGGYVRSDGVLSVLRLYVMEADDVAEDDIWLQAECYGTTDGRIFIPGFSVTGGDTEVTEASGESGTWLYVEGTVTGPGTVSGDTVLSLGDGPIRFPRS